MQIRFPQTLDMYDDQLDTKQLIIMCGSLLI